MFLTNHAAFFSPTTSKIFKSAESQAASCAFCALNLHHQHHRPRPPSPSASSSSFGDNLAYLLKKNIMNQGASQQEQILATFASCFSSAQTYNTKNGDLEHQQQGQDSSEQLRLFISPSVDSDQKLCSVPSMSLKHTNKHTHTSPSTKASLEQDAAMNLARPLEATRDELPSLPLSVLCNISDAFMSLVDSRIRSYLTALSLQSNRGGDLNNNNKISPVLALIMSSSSTLVRPTAIVNSFRIVGNSVDTGDDNQKVCPLLLETMIDLDILGEVMTVTIAGNGNIVGGFEDVVIGPMLTGTILQIDTQAFLHSMMAQVRAAVRKAIGIISNLFLPTGTSIPSALSIPAHETEQSNDSQQHTTLQQNNFGISMGSQGATFSMPPPLARRDYHTQSSPPAQPQHPNESNADTSGGGKTESKDHEIFDGGLALLTKAAVALKRDNEDESCGLTPSKQQQPFKNVNNTGVHHQTAANVEEV